MPKKKDPFGTGLSLRALSHLGSKTQEAIADDLPGKSTPRHSPAAMHGWYLLKGQTADSQSASPILLSAV